MLVLARKVGEEIVIDGNIRVKILGFQGKQVRVGIIAPTNIPVLRNEIADNPKNPKFDQTSR